MYLAEKVGKFYPQDLRGKYAVNEWLIWQMANQGPKSGECGHFRRLDASKGDQTYAITRFTDEVNRLYGVMNNRLYDSKYLAGDQYTIADMICYPWTVNWKAQGQDIEEFKYFKRWFEEMGARPACSAAWRWARTCPKTRRHCRRRKRIGARRCCTTSAPARCRWAEREVRCGRPAFPRHGPASPFHHGRA